MRFSIISFAFSTLLFVACSGGDLSNRNEPIVNGPDGQDSVADIGGISEEGIVVTITGSGFGEGGKVVIFDSFESGSHGSSLVGQDPDIGPLEWRTEPYLDHPDITNEYDSDQVSAGNFSYRQHVVADNLGGPNGVEWKEPLTMNFGDTHPLKRFYLSYFHLYHREGDAAGQVKMPRLSGDHEYNGPPSVGVTQQDNGGSTAHYVTFEEFVGDWVPGAHSVDTWNRIEMYGDVELGFSRYARDLNLASEVSTGGLEDTPLGRLALNNVHQMKENSSGVYDYYFDNLYLSDTWARIEIGNAANWDDCTERSVIPFESWSDTEIVVNVEPKYIGFSGDRYLFVVDAEGNPSPGQLVE